VGDFEVDGAGRTRLKVVILEPLAELCYLNANGGVDPRVVIGRLAQRLHADGVFLERFGRIQGLGAQISQQRVQLRPIANQSVVQQVVKFLFLLFPGKSRVSVLGRLCLHRTHPAPRTQ